MARITAEEARKKGESYSVDKSELLESICQQISTQAEYGNFFIQHAYSMDKYSKELFDYISDELSKLGYIVENSEDSNSYGMTIRW